MGNLESNKNAIKVKQAKRTVLHEITTQVEIHIFMYKI